MRQAKWSSVPVINCGDGWGEHPTQVLIDLYTIWKEKGRIDGLKILCIGYMRMRTMHSIGYAASQFDVELTFVSPPDMALTEEFKRELEEVNVRFRIAESAEEGIVDADVIYMEPVVQPDYTKSRVEITEDKGLTPPQYRVTRELPAKKAKSDAMILHSLPRMDELPPDVDATRHARYWIEAFNGVVMRMTLLSLILGAVE
jgi:aspartate carbamoyltransferase catalytic subunit